MTATATIMTANVTVVVFALGRINEEAAAVSTTAKIDNIIKITINLFLICISHPILLFTSVQ
jgi:hypothetical protein